MCTVSYIPTKEGFVLTSNRDEKTQRPTEEPSLHEVNESYLCFPKDIEAGGSWIAASENGRVCCLLNGAFEPHSKQQWHTHSRGKVLLDVTAYFGNPNQFFDETDLSIVEPFTMIVIETKHGNVLSIYEYVWDGQTVMATILDSNTPKIWSSATLYSKDVKENRRVWFNKFIETAKDTITKSNILDFHTGNHSDDETQNVVMQRDGLLQTVSITQVANAGNKLEMVYYDRVANTSSQVLI